MGRKLTVGNMKYAVFLILEQNRKIAKWLFNGASRSVVSKWSWRLGTLEVQNE
jgi:hypothetical protein